jgi:hypothetical protein
MIFRLCTQDKNGFYEAIVIEESHYHYYLFDSPHKPWRIFGSLADCERFLTTELRQPLLTFENEADYHLFSYTVAVSHPLVWLNGQLTPTINRRIPPESIIMMDTGKDWVALIQEPDLTFVWQPQLDHSYRHLGERLITIQDAIRKIDDMPIYIFESEMLAQEFFKNNFPRPELIPLPKFG